MSTTALTDPYPEVTIERLPLPPLPPRARRFNRRRGMLSWADVYAYVIAGEIRAVIQRFAYRDKDDDLNVTFEVRIDGGVRPPRCAEVYATHSETLYRLAAVCHAAGALRDELERVGAL